MVRCSKLVLFAVTFAWGFCSVVGLAQAAASTVSTERGLPVLDLNQGEDHLREHRLGAEGAVHLTPAEYDEMRRSREERPGQGVSFQIVVSEDGRVDSATVVGEAKRHADEAKQIELARVFKPWTRDGTAVRVRVYDYVRVLPPERWADTHVAFPERWNPLDVRIGLKRSPQGCVCPTYEVTVSGDGTVKFSGETSIAIPGDHVAHVSPERVRELALDFKGADFLSALNSYTYPVTDNESRELTLTLAGKTKRLVDYAGLWAGLPIGISDLEEEVDEVAGTARWVKGDDRTLASLKEEKWPFAASTSQNIALFVKAIDTGNTPLVAEFLDAGGPVVSPDARQASPVCAASASDDLDLVKRMMSRSDDKGHPKEVAVPEMVADQCLEKAASSGSLVMSQYWLDHGADPAVTPAKVNEDWTSGNSILAGAVTSGNVDLVRKLMGYKIDLRATLPSGVPLIMYAVGARARKAEMIQLLASAGADVNARNEQGETAVFGAIYSTEAIKPLLAAGADIEARDRSGNTALIRYGFMEPMVRELLADGADPTQVATNGDTALTVAKQYQCSACAALIEEALKQRTEGKIHYRVARRSE
jgi:ankyrin repeat protein